MKFYTLDNKFIEETSSFPSEFRGIVEWPDGGKQWFVNGDLHRLDGPAIECPSGQKEWFVDDKRHRLDGPAIEHPNGAKLWFVNGKQITKEHCKLLYSIIILKGLL